MAVKLALKTRCDFEALNSYRHIIQILFRANYHKKLDLALFHFDTWNEIFLRVITEVMLYNSLAAADKVYKSSPSENVIGSFLLVSNLTNR